MGNYSTGVSGGIQFQSYINRNPVPHTQSGSDSPLWYSVDVGPAHMIYLTNYDSFTEGSDQYTWLANDLAKRVSSSHLGCFSHFKHEALTYTA